MKTEINYTQKNTTANYIFFGITLSIFLLSLFFSIMQNKTELYTSSNLSAILTQKTVQPVVTSLTEVQPIDLKKLLVEVTEEPIVIENWMTDTKWTSSNSAALTSYLNTEVVEEAIPLESWMISTSNWSLVNDVDFIEASIPLESWMLNTNSWEVLNEATYFNENSIIEEAIPLESWMLNINEWNLSTSENYTEALIPLENWMLSTESWNFSQTDNTLIAEEDIPLENWMLNVDSWEVLNNEKLASK